MTPSLARQMRLPLRWSVFSGIIHIVWELPWCLLNRSLHLNTTAAWALPWTIYGHADRRYLLSDPFTLSLEWVTVLVVGSLNFLTLNAYRRGHIRQSALFLLVGSVMETYGTVLYFGTELFNGFGNFNTGNWVDLWLKVVFFNVLWIIFPGICIYRAIRILAPPASLTELATSHAAD